MSVRIDKKGAHRTVLASNRKKIYATQTVCGICKKPVNKSLKYPHPLSKTVDHIVPISANGHPSAMENLQLAHMVCNRQKSDKVFAKDKGKKVVANRMLEHSIDWKNYTPKK